MTPYENISGTLTPQEIDVFVGIVAYRGLNIIAEQLGRSLEDVESTRETVLGKLGCRCTSEVRRYATRLGVSHVKTVRELMECK